MAITGELSTQKVIIINKSRYLEIKKKCKFTLQKATSHQIVNHNAESVYFFTQSELTWGKQTEVTGIAVQMWVPFPPLGGDSIT